jgi:hypothetical protein
MVRRIPAASYLQRFCSDRSPMLGTIPADRFPEYPVINAGTSYSPIPLYAYWDMTKVLDDGSRVFDVDEYLGITSPG